MTATKIKKEVIEKEYKDTNLFVNNEDLKEFIHGIHNFMRNNGFGYGKRALETFNFFYGLKLIENKLDKMHFSEDKNENEKYKEILDYKNLIKLAEKRKKENYGIGSQVIYITDRLENIIKTLENFGELGDPREPIYKYIYHDIPNKKTLIKEEKWYKLIMLINKLPVGYEKSRVNLSGKVYEYFIGKDKQALTDLGAYFTDRHITEKIYEKLSIELDSENNVKTMIDPFGGSGGFTLGYANYLMDNYKDLIDWKKNVNNIYHFDMEEYVINMTGLEMFAITGELPKTNEYNYSPGNTFTRDFINTNNKCEKYDYVISNPPYGGDSISKGAEQIKNDLLTEHIKKNIERIKKIMKEHIPNSKNLNELINSINRLNFIVVDDTSKKLCEQNIKKFENIKSKYEDNDKLIELIDEYKKCNEQLCYLNYKLKKYKRKQASMQVNYGTCSERIKKFVKNINIQNEKYNETNDTYEFVDGKMRVDSVNDKEACSLILLMDLVKENGVCCAVLKEGVFFDSSYSELRNALVNNYNVSDIISVDQNSFENTSTKTSIIIFKNNGKTKKINFSELVVKRTMENKILNDDSGGEIWKADLKKEFYDKSEIYENILKLEKSGFLKVNNWNYLGEIKGEIESVEIVPICSASYKDISKVIITKDKKGNDIRKYDYSLNYKDYKDNKVFCPEGYELKKLGDICEIKYGTRITKEKDGVDKNSINSYPVYGGGDITFYTKKYNRDGTSYVISRFGISKTCVRIIEQKIFLNDGAFTIHNDNKLIENYIGSYLFLNQNIVYDCNTGSCQKGTDIELFRKIQIPIPKDLTTLKKELTQLQKLHQVISTNTELIHEKEKYICELIKKLTDEGKEGVDYDSKKFGELVEYQAKTKKYKASAGKITGKYKFYTSSQDKILFIDEEPLFKECMLIMGRNGDTSVHYDSNFSCEHDHVYVMKVKQIKTQYLYYYVVNNVSWFKNEMNGSTIKGTSKEILSKFTVRTLKPSIMSKHKLQELFDEVDKLKDTLEMNKQEYQTQLKALFKDFQDNDNEESTDKVSEKTDLDDLEAELEENLTSVRPKNNVIIDDSKSNKSSTSSKSSTSNNSLKQKIFKINGVSCIKENNEYYVYNAKAKGNLFAIENKKGNIKLVEKPQYEYLTINGIEHILIDNDVYTIVNDKPCELYGHYENEKFTKIKKIKKIKKSITV
jgi:type I restriction-modification system DNA methylase subunit